MHAIPSQVVAEVQLSNAQWATTPVIPLNPGLIAIIGARGSGKKALADIIAAGCDAITPSGWSADTNVSPSFLVRARPLIGQAQVTLTWGGGSSVTRALNGNDANSPFAYPRARYGRVLAAIINEQQELTGLSSNAATTACRASAPAYGFWKKAGRKSSSGCITRRSSISMPTSKRRISATLAPRCFRR